ncbi:MAG: hypothetical protein ACD_49C00038G0009 [uncultured bacterium (gcode 4)]|uniref:Uncharacterized protein n=1 Tax=uncultured bacterium (gcode 4) TaxID=1234023 RepID=K2AEJ3_9BACT|nr:MAG: hypothetical protein ACD_49C00038G0009 [uncultured bacterium (gcode 4)]
MHTKKNIHHIIPVSRNWRKCDNNEIVVSLKWHQKIHSVFWVMVTHEKILHLLDSFWQEKDGEEFVKCLDFQLENETFYLWNCFNRGIKWNALKWDIIIRNLENPALIFPNKNIKEIIFQILNWDIKVLNENSLLELCDVLG